MFSPGFFFGLLPFRAQADLIGDVRAQLAQNSLSAAESELKNYKSQHGVTPEYLEALSWMARGAASTKQWDQATAYASETRRLCEQQLTKRKLDSDPHLPVALGAAYEVLAQTLAEKGQHARSGQPAALGVGTLWKYLHSSAAPEEPQPAGSGRSTRAAPTSNPVSRTEASNSGRAERFASSIVLLGALVCGLQSRGPHHRPLAAGVRSRGPGRHRSNPTLRLRSPRSRRNARTGARIYRIRPRQILRQPEGYARAIEQTELQCLRSKYDADAGRPESRRPSSDVSSRSAFVRRTAQRCAESGSPLVTWRDTVSGWRDGRPRPSRVA